MKKTGLFVVSLLAISFAHAQFNVNITFISGGISRTAVLHSPSGQSNNVPENLPVVIVLHGDGGTGSGIQGYAGFDAVANAQNFIAVYPNAINNSWNRYVDDVAGDAGLGNASAPDDVLFITDLIDYLCANYSINTTKVFATGHSAGGFLAYNLAIQANSKIAAFAPVAASLWGDNAFITNFFTNSTARIPILHIHGDADGTVNYPDANHQADAYGEWPLNSFSALNCGNTTYQSTTPVVTNVSALNFCNTNPVVRLIRIQGGSHSWPSVANFNAAQTIWDFFDQYQISTNSPCDAAKLNENIVEFTISPVPMQEVVEVTSTSASISKLMLFSLSGEEVIHSTTNTLQVGSIPKGTYLLRVDMEGYPSQVRKVIK